MGEYHYDCSQDAASEGQDCSLAGPLRPLQAHSRTQFIRCSVDLETEKAQRMLKEENQLRMKVSPRTPHPECSGKLGRSSALAVEREAAEPGFKFLFGHNSLRNLEPSYCLASFSYWIRLQLIHAVNTSMVWLFISP